MPSWQFFFLEVLRVSRARPAYLGKIFLSMLFTPLVACVALLLGSPWGEVSPLWVCSERKIFPRFTVTPLKGKLYKFVACVAYSTKEI
jgi:hypothetical protein